MLIDVIMVEQPLTLMVRGAAHVHPGSLVKIVKQVGAKYVFQYPEISVYNNPVMFESTLFMPVMIKYSRVIR